jgi:hypothetical protein
MHRQAPGSNIELRRVCRSHNSAVRQPPCPTIALQATWGVAALICACTQGYKMKWQFQRSKQGPRQQQPGREARLHLAQLANAVSEWASTPQRRQEAEETDGVQRHHTWSGGCKPDRRRRRRAAATRPAAPSGVKAETAHGFMQAMCREPHHGAVRRRGRHHGETAGARAKGTSHGGGGGRRRSIALASVAEHRVWRADDLPAPRARQVLAGIKSGANARAQQSRQVARGAGAHNLCPSIPRGGPVMKWR